MLSFVISGAKSAAKLPIRADRVKFKRAIKRELKVNLELDPARARDSPRTINCCSKAVSKIT